MKELHKNYLAYFIYQDGNFYIKPLPKSSFWKRVRMALDVFNQNATAIYYSAKLD